MAARLVDEELANVVEVLKRQSALLENRASLERPTPPVTIRKGSPPVW